MLKFRWETEFKETEIGEIPRDWEIKEVKDLVDKTLKFPIVDGPFGTQLHMDEYTSEGVPVIRVINLSFEGEFIEDDLVFISEEKFNTLKRSSVKPNDLIIAKTGATIGKLALLPEHINQGLIASSCLKITFGFKKAFPKFYLYFFMTQVGQESIKNRAEGGSTRDTINLTPFSEIPVPLPPLPEQSRIATVLSYFDDLIEVKKRQNEILEKTAMAIFKSWFIDFEPFKNEEFVYNEELGKEIPKGWEVNPIEKEFYLIKGRKYEVSDDYFEGYSPYLLIETFKTGKKEFWTSEKEPQVDENDVVLVADGESSGKVLRYQKGILGSTLLTLKPKSGNFIELKHLIYLTLKFYEDEIMSHRTGSAIPHLDKDFLKSFLMLLPPPTILQRFHSLVEPLFQKIILNQKQIMTIRRIRDTLLPLLVFGKLRVEEL